MSLSFEQVSLGVLIISLLYMVYMNRRDALRSVDAIAQILRDERSHAQAREKEAFDNAMKDKMFLSQQLDKTRDALVKVKVVAQAQQAAPRVVSNEAGVVNGAPPVRTSRKDLMETVAR